MVSWLITQAHHRVTDVGTYARGTDVGAPTLTPAVSALGCRQAAQLVRPLGERSSQTRPASRLS